MALYLGNNRVKIRTAPYVKYTAVGSPTIVDSVVSGFSSSNHLELTSTFDPKKPYKIQAKFKLDSNFSGNANTLLGVQTAGIFNLRINQSGKINLLVGNGTQDFNVSSITGTTTLVANTDYWAQAEFTGTQYKIALSTEGVSFTSEGSASGTVPSPGNPFTLQIGDGHTGHWYLRGDIDLKETWIMQESQYWWRGDMQYAETYTLRLGD